MLLILWILWTSCFGTPSRAPSPRSVAVLTRVVDSELPYLYSFLLYYLDDIAVDHIYLVIAKPLVFQEEFKTILLSIENVCGFGLVTTQTFDSQIDYDHPVHDITKKIMANDKWQRGYGVQNIMLGQIKEEYVIHVDPDEYWVWQNFDLDAETPDVVIGKWVFLSFQYKDRRTIPVQRGGKYVVKTSEVIWFGEHLPILKNNSQKVRVTGARVYHYWGRSLADMLLKIKMNQDRLSVDNRFEILVIIQKALECYGQKRETRIPTSIVNVALENRLLALFADIANLTQQFEEHRNTLPCPPRNVLEKNFVKRFIPSFP